MEAQIKSFYWEGHLAYPIDIFGYSSKSLPGLEIIGLGSKGKGMKEKFIYLSRIRNLRIPFKRYVLCVEPSSSQKRDSHLKGELDWLELPLLLLFWFLCGHLNIHCFDHCISCGQISIDGQISVLDIESRLLLDLQKKDFYSNFTRKHYIGLNEFHDDRLMDINVLPIQEILALVRDISFGQQKRTQIERALSNSM